MAKLFGLTMVAALVLICGMSWAVTADEKFDVTGNWDCTVDVMGQGGTPSFTLKQEGEKLTGKYKGMFGEADLTGKVDGNKIEFSFDTMGLKISYKGTIKDKDNMEGEVNLGEVGNGTWKGKRKPA